MENNKGKYSVIYEILIILLALIAVTITILDLSSVISLSQGSFLYWVDLTILAIFSIDYFTRLFFAKEKITFFKNNIFDLIAIIPFNSMFRIFKTFKFLRFFRVKKVFRLTRMTRLIRGFALVKRLKRKLNIFIHTNGFIYSIYITITTLILGTIGVYFIEFKAQGVAFSECLWWSFATTTTVGYDGISPETLATRLIAAILMLVGIAFTGMLTGTIATYFLDSKNFKEDDSIQEQEAFIDISDLESDEIKQIKDYVEFLRNRT